MIGQNVPALTGIVYPVGRKADYGWQIHFSNRRLLIYQCRHQKLGGFSGSAMCGDREISFEETFAIAH